MRRMSLVPPRSRKSAVFAALMGASAASLLLPRSWTDGPKHLMQVLVPPQDLLFQTSRAAARMLCSDAAVHGAGASAATADDAERRSRRDALALENQVIALSGQLDTVRRENSLLRGLREKYIPPGVLLVPAQVVARDIGGWRDSLLLSRGASQRIERGDAAASRLFLTGGEADGVAVGHLVLAREVLLGRVDEVGPFTSRLRLFSDVGLRTEVRVGRRVESRFVVVDYPCTLLGRGAGEMIIEDVPLRHVAEGPHAAAGGDGMRVGDWVISPPGAPGLPTPMTLGRVAGFKSDPRKRLVATVHVEGLLSPDDVGDVFVVATGRRE
jgi:hypothetical protein